MLIAHASTSSAFGACGSEPTATTKPRRRFFWHRRPNHKVTSVKLPRPFRRLARQLNLDSEQRQLLHDMLAQLTSLRREFAQRRTEEAGRWLSLLGAQQFDSETAMELLRGHSRWLEEKLAELIMQYSALHASLNAAQREYLVQMMSRYLWNRRRRARRI